MSAPATKKKFVTYICVTFLYPKMLYRGTDGKGKRRREVGKYE
jgi:hypothetical protein